MIHNPAQITSLLRQYEAMRATPLGGPSRTSMLAELLLRHIGHQPAWDAFVRLYHLYLQSIPEAEAKAAWGVNNSAYMLQSLIHQAPNPNPKSEPQ